jgi:hypothetical protein
VIEGRREISELTAATVVLCNTLYILECAELWAVVSGLGPADQPYSRMDKYTQEGTTRGMKEMTEV